MLEPQLNSILEHVKTLKPTTEGDQVPEMGTRMMVLCPNLEPKVMLMGKPQLMPKKVRELLRLWVPVLESRCSVSFPKPKPAEGLRWEL